ncbi:hypothetical protein JKA73_17590 [Myxococcus xanthus]|uniref:hypothetical protein n=1 Tax=Myxococcus xanthus TaxID=34 RepID=UPI0019170C4E|nr:hypothetical protein [Myxococcus xanthus]QQR47750.1 hypothetical protein JKA73_17590 [Myxococcus xanthus]
MRLFLMVAATILAAGLTSCGLCDNDVPQVHKGARLTGCSGTTNDEIACCSYSSTSCMYVLCRDSACGDWEESSWACMPTTAPTSTHTPAQRIAWAEELKPPSFPSVTFKAREAPAYRDLYADSDAWTRDMAYSLLTDKGLQGQAKERGFTTIVAGGRAVVDGVGMNFVWSANLLTGEVFTPGYSP